MDIKLLSAGDDDLHIRAISALNQFVMSRERSSELLSEPTYLFIVALDTDGDVMGRIYGHVLHRYEQTDLLLYEVDVTDKHQRKGVGKAMIEYVRKLCAQRNYREMWVLTEEDNVAGRSLYLNSGGRLEHSPTMMYVYDIFSH